MMIFTNGCYMRPQTASWVFSPHVKQFYSCFPRPTGAPTKCPKMKRPSLETSQIQNVPLHKVPPIKRPNPKTSQLQNVPSPKTSQPQNVPTPKPPKPQKSRAPKLPKPQNIPTPRGPNYKTSQASKRPSLLGEFLFRYVTVEAAYRR
jgi:outer membrane biosynthesis protein TonB